MPKTEVSHERLMDLTTYSKGDIFKEEIRGMAGELILRRQEVKELRQQIISGFYEEPWPQYTQGWPTHELEEIMTAEEASRSVLRLESSIALIRRVLAWMALATPPEESRSALIEELSNWQKTFPPSAPYRSQGDTGGEAVLRMRDESQGDTGGEAVLRMRDEFLQLVNCYNKLGEYTDAKDAQEMAVLLNRFEEEHGLTSMLWPPEVTGADVEFKVHPTRS